MNIEQKSEKKNNNQKEPPKAEGKHLKTESISSLIRMNDELEFESPVPRKATHSSENTLEREINILEKLKKIENFYQDKQSILEEKIKVLEVENAKLSNELFSRQEDLEKWKNLSREHEGALTSQLSVLKREVEELRFKLDGCSKREKSRMIYN